MTSPDGITWTTRTSAANNAWLSVCWSPELGIFVAVANSGSGTRVMTANYPITVSSTGAVTFGPNGLDEVSHTFKGSGLASGPKFNGPVSNLQSYPFLECNRTDFTAIVTFNAFVEVGRHRTHTYLVTVRAGTKGSDATLLDTGSGATVTVTFFWSNFTKNLSFLCSTNCDTASVTGLVIG